MLQSPSLLLTLFAFILLLAPLVVIHELGHYLVARLFGVKADVFSVGFGKELFGWTDKRGTRWKLSALPLGGYVQFAGDWNAISMPDATAASLPPDELAKTFHIKPLWQRALIVAAGPLTNLLFAIIIFAAFNLAFGKIVTEAKVAAFLEKSDARAAGLQIGDRIVAIGGDPVETFDEVTEHVVYFPGRTILVSVDREGRNFVVPVKLSTQVFRDKFGNEGKVADLGIDYAMPIVADFAANSAAKLAGMEVGDEILAVDGIKVSSFEEVRKLVLPHPGKAASLTIRRNGQVRGISVALGAVTMIDKEGKRTSVGQLGIVGGKLAAVGPIEAVSIASKQTAGTIRMMVTGLGQIIGGERSVKELGGPIKIAQYSGQQLSLGWLSFATFAALISINLAFINFLPIPGLDGGHLAFYAAEAVRRKPMDARSQEWAFRAGMALVLALMVFVTLNDIMGLPWLTWFKG